MNKDMSDEWEEFFNENSVVVKVKDIREKNKQIEELEKQLKELPKKICCDIEELGNQGDFIEISHSKLNEIIEKYTKEQEDERNKV